MARVKAGRVHLCRVTGRPNIATLHGNTKVWRSKWFTNVYQVTEIVVDNAGVEQMTSQTGLG